MLSPFDTYKEYLAYKNHFTKEKYDYQRYGGKSRAKIDSFYKRKDRYFFEKMSRKYKDPEIKDFFLASIKLSPIVVAFNTLPPLEKILLFFL